MNESLDELCPTLMPIQSLVQRKFEKDVQSAVQHEIKKECRRIQEDGMAMGVENWRTK